MLPRLELSALDIARGALYFPLVGAFVGSTVGGSAILLADALPSLAAAGVALALGALLTGAMHLDALADTADALGGRDRAHALEIMRDHRIGAYGAVAVGVGLLVKASAISELAAHRQLAAFATAGALSRAVAVAIGAVLPYAHAGEGIGRVFTERTSAARALATVMLTGAFGFATHEWELVVAATIVAIVLGAHFKHWLGGVTGDTLGSAVEIAETAALVVAASLL
jgi:adenosylcobinamide-GDP ribazoletransferase